MKTTSWTSRFKPGRVLAGALSLIGFLLPRTAFASFAPPEGPFGKSGARVADAVGGSMALMPAIVAASGCAFALLPVDLGFVATTDKKFGAVTEDLCTYPVAGVLFGIYFVFGAPVFAIERPLASVLP